MGRSDPPLGRITAGAFSTSRGVCHGVGVVGAIRLLDYLGESIAADGKESKGENSSYGRIVRLANGSQSLQLLVRVGNMVKQQDRSEDDEKESFGCEASLSA